MGILLSYIVYIHIIKSAEQSVNRVLLAESNFFIFYTAVISGGKFLLGKRIKNPLRAHDEERRGRECTI